MGKQKPNNYLQRSCPISCLDRSWVSGRTMVDCVFFLYSCCNDGLCRRTGRHSSNAWWSSFGMNLKHHIQEPLNNNIMLLLKSDLSSFHKVYREIPIISPGLIFVQKPFLLGLFSGELIFGGAYYWKEFCGSK